MKQEYMEKVFVEDLIACWHLSHSAFVFQQCQATAVEREPAGKLTNSHH